jgi:hypothetical protein
MGRRLAGLLGVIAILKPGSDAFSWLPAAALYALHGSDPRQMP